MSWKKKILGAFVEIEEEKVKPIKVEVTQPPPLVYTPPASNNSVREFSDHFRQIMKEENDKNFPGNDFYEFLVVKNAMAAIPSEQQRYEIAFSGLLAAGLSKDKLLSTAQAYLNIVEREIGEFTSSYDSMYADKVTKVDEIIKKKSEEMSALSQRITVLNNEISELKSQSMENSQKLADKKNGFLLAGNAQKEEILTEIEKIKQYIA